MEHRLIPSNQRHAPHSWEVANQTARLALAPTTADKGKICLQTEPAGIWTWTGTHWLAAEQVVIFPDHDALVAAVVAERANIAAQQPVWADRQPLRVSTEPMAAFHLWHRDTSLINPIQQAAASNAWNIVLGNMQASLLNDDGQVFAGSSAPADTLGVTGDWYANYSTGQLLRKNYSNQWEVISGASGPRIPPELVENDPTVPQIGQTFTAYMASRERPPHTAVNFGTGATIPTAENGFAVKNLSDLAAIFDPLQAGTGATTLNSELQVYPPAFNSENTEIAADKLILRAKLNSGASWNGKVWSQSDGSKSLSLTAGATQLWDRIPVRTDLAVGTYDWRNGQVWCVYGKGAYVTDQMNPGTSFKLIALSGAPTTGTMVYNSVVMTPIESAIATTSTSNTATEIQFAPNSLHTNIQPGYRVVVSQSDRVARQAADVWVQAIDHATGLVTLNRNMPISNSMPAGSRFLFYPRISAGQIWSKEGWDIAATDTFFATEFDVEICAGMSTTANTRNVNNNTAYNTLNNANPTVAWGLWSALWGYPHSMGGGSAGTNEMDFSEIWGSATEGFFQHSNGVLGPGVGAVTYNKTDSGYSVSGTGKNLVPFSMVGNHKVAFIYAGQKAYAYIDDVLVKIQSYQWQTARYIQIGMNVAFGWISSGGAANLNVPVTTQHFTYATQAIKSWRVWIGE